MFFGIPIWLLKWLPPYDATLRKLPQLGLKGVELIAWSPANLHEYYTRSTIQELRRILTGEGLLLSNFNFSPRNLAASDKMLRQEAVEDLSRAMDIARELNCAVITSVAPYPFSRRIPGLPILASQQELEIAPEGNLDFADNYQGFVEALATCCGLAASYRLQMAIEPHPFRWVATAQDMLRLIEHVQADNLGLNYDPSHLIVSGNIPSYAIYLLKSRIFHVHAGDNDGHYNFHWRPGKGKIDWPEVLRAFHATGYNGALSLELTDVPGVARHEQEATAQFEREIFLAKKYFSEICEEYALPIIDA